MPKEVTHWSIADNVLECLAEGVLKESIKQNYHVYLLGSVFHDVLYYCTSDNGECQEFADILHGVNREDTSRIISTLIKRYHETDAASQDVLLAYISGIVTHIYSDSKFHPFVYFHTGNYYDKDPIKRKKAAREHRMLESVIDLFLEPHAKLSSKYDVVQIVENSLLSLSEVLKSDIKLDGISVTFESISNAAKNFKLARKIYTNKILFILLNSVRGVLPENIRTVLDLSYHHRDVTKHSLVPDSGEVEYRHPVTNEYVVTNINSLKSDCVKKSVKILNSLNASASISNFNGPGPSLETGLVGVHVDDMRFFL